MYNISIWSNLKKDLRCVVNMHPLQTGVQKHKICGQNHNTKMYDLVAKWDSSFKKSYDHSTVTLIKTNCTEKFKVCKILQAELAAAYCDGIRSCYDGAPAV